MRLYRHLIHGVTSLLSAAALLLALGEPAAAQLANGPWSMYRHDVCHTGQSPNLGPLFGTVTVPGTPDPTTDIKVWHGFDKLRTSPSLSADGKTIFFGMGFDFCAVDTETMTTNECMLLPADVSDSSPAVGANGTVYMGDRDNSLGAYVMNPATKDVSLKWRYNNGHEGDIWQHPVIAPAGLPAAGTIYFTHDQTTDGAGIFTALTDSGSTPTVKWKYKIGNFVRTSSPVIDSRGVIYFGDLVGYIYAFKDKGACMDRPSLRQLPSLSSTCSTNQSGPVLLGRRLIGSTPGITASPVISADSNTLYVGTNTGLVALDISDPKSCWAASPQAPCAPSPVRWKFVTSGKVDQTPALGRDGTVYVPAMDGGQKRLYAVTPTGTQKWVFGPINTGSETSAYPIVGGDDKVYVGLGNSIYGLKPATGALLWSYATSNLIQSSPLIGPVTDGRAILYLPSRDHNLYAISSPRPNTTTPVTCWASDGPIGNQAPVANAGPDQSASVNQPVIFDATGSYDPDGDPLIVTWNFGDGHTSGPCQASSPGCLNPTHTYTTANPTGYTATVTVSDGELSDDDTVQITVTAGGGGPPGAFTDSFNRADSDTLNPSPTGTQWSEVAGNLVIANQQLKNGLRGDNIAILPSLVGTTQSASGDFISNDNNASPRLGVLLRVQGTDSRNHYRLYRISGGTSQLRISKFVNGAETVLKWVQVPLAPVGTPFHLVGSISGTTLTLTMGTVQITATDSTFPNGSIGVLVNTGPAATHAADNFCAINGAGTCP